MPRISATWEAVIGGLSFKPSPGPKARVHVKNKLKCKRTGA
jgi:hypothetical protein